MRQLSQIFILFLLTGSFATLTAQVMPQPEQPEILQSNDISDQELNHFVNVIQHVEKVQQQSQPRMLKAIEDQGMEPQQYIEATQAEQMGQDSGLEGDDKKKFQAVQKDIEKIQTEANSQIEEKIENEKLTIERFNQLFMSYQQDQNLQERVQNQMEKLQGQ